MIIPIVKIPASIAEGLSIYTDLFGRSETIDHIHQYCTGLVVLEKPSIKRMSQCLVNGPCQSSLNKAITTSPWSEQAVHQRRIESIAPYHQRGFSVGIVDSTFMHHPRGQNIYGVYKYWDYVENCYTYAIQLVTAAISTGERVDPFDYRIYHRSFELQEKAYLEHSGVGDSETDKAVWERRLMEVLAYQRNRQEAKTKSEVAVELIDEMEQSALAPDAYAVDSGLFTPTIISRIEQLNKPWVADSEKNRILYHKGERYNCETFNATLEKSAFKPITVRLGSQEKTRWVFSCTVRIGRYGKVRLAIIYHHPDKEGTPIFVFTNMLVWNATKLLSVRLHRWDIEPLHEQIKQFLGAESSQLQTENGVRKHLTLVFVVNSLLKSLDLSSPIGDLSIEWSQNDVPTFGQRCRRVILEVFYDLIAQVHHDITTGAKKLTEIFTTLFQQLLSA